MAYTVKQLADLSGVSVRTLHWYDEIGLLRPAWHGAGGVRHYESEQLLMLQQILFFRELGLSLKQIQKILGRSDFDKIEALLSHRKVLQKSLEKTRRLIKTVDETVAHLKGETKMSDQALYAGFSEKKQKEYEEYLIDRYGDQVKTQFAQAKENTQNWSKQDFQQAQSEGEQLWKEFTAAINQGLRAESPEVQALVRRHCAWLKQFWTPNRDSYIGLGQLYTSHPDFRKYYAAYHPNLADFLSAAMTFFAQKELPVD